MTLVAILIRMSSPSQQMPSPVRLLPWAIALYAAYRYYLRVRRPHLSLWTNLLSWYLDGADLLPFLTEGVRTPEELQRVVEKHRFIWKDTVAKAAMVIPKTKMRLVKEVEVPSRSGSSQVNSRGDSQGTLQGSLQGTLQRNSQSRGENPHYIKCRLYKPTGGDANLPVIMTLHGGGWSLGSPDIYDEFNRRVAQGSNAVVVAVDYRLAPEHKFPKGLEDCEDVMAWIWAENQTLVEFGGSPKMLGFAICGDSAGGQLTAVLAVHAKKSNIDVTLQGLIYPAVAACCLPLWRSPPYIPQTKDSTNQNARGGVLTYPGMLLLWESLLNDPTTEFSDPRVSPILFSLEDLKGTADAVVFTGFGDVLRDEGEAYAKRLKAASVPTEHVEFPDTLHAFMSLFALKGYEESFAYLCAAMRKSFEKYQKQRSGMSS